MDKLTAYGANDRFFAEATLYPDLFLGRVILQYKDTYRVVTEEGEGLATVSGKYRYEAACPADYPVVGDFVMVDRHGDDSGSAIIHHLLTRKSSFERIAAGKTGHTQVVASNIDVLFLCMSLNNDYNLSRLERYLSAAWNSQSTPVVVLTKSDLCEDTDAVLDEVSSVAIGVDVIITSSADPNTFTPLWNYMQKGSTASFIGSSGVGKSTLINCLAGEELAATSGIRQDDKGRHTTTRRDLLLLPQGGIVIDTPGMRELEVDSVDLSQSFSDIDELISQCKFRDCSHRSEPGCAIRQALENGSLEHRRFENYLKIKEEAKYEGLTSKQIEQKKIEAMFGGKNQLKQTRNYVKSKNKPR